MYINTKREGEGERGRERETHRHIMKFKHVCRWMILFRDFEKQQQKYVGETGFRCGDIGTVLV